PDDSHDLVQKAIESEHATIPAYSAAYFTLKPGTNVCVGEILRSIIREEMLHMAIACNSSIAIGGRPVINEPGFIPTYPGPSPMNIGDSVVPIKKCSLRSVRDVFMAIEEPEEPIPIHASEGRADFRTIGEFYAALEEKSKESG
ncbi:hypothetical protein OY671_013104, partial [Metschnikowia pulcherrima]